MSSRQGRECGPGLSAWWNVLPFFFANYALRRRDIARCVLGAAGSANECFHITVPARCALCTLIIDRPRPASLGFTRRKTRNGVGSPKGDRGEEVGDEAFTPSAFAGTAEIGRPRSRIACDAIDRCMVRPCSGPLPMVHRFEVQPTLRHIDSHGAGP